MDTADKWNIHWGRNDPVIFILLALFLPNWVQCHLEIKSKHLIITTMSALEGLFFRPLLSLFLSPFPDFFSVLSPYFLPCNSHFPYGFHSYPVPILSAKIISSETLNMAVHIVSMGLGGKSPSAMNEGRTHFSEPLFQAVCCLRKALPAPFTLSPWLLCFLLHLLWVRKKSGSCNLNSGCLVCGVHASSPCFPWARVDPWGGCQMRASWGGPL